MSSESAANARAKDWHYSKQIAKRARFLLEHLDEEIPTDVTFLVGDGQSEPQKTFRCHKFLLAMVSSMFQAMFYGSLPETEDPIKIPDVTPTAFQQMLRYAYGGYMDLDDMSVENALDTLYCAKKYLIDKLARACRDHIQLEIGVYREDPCVVFQRAPQMDEDDLATLALVRIGKYTEDVMHGDALPRLSFECLKNIVDYPHLNADEIEIYDGVRRWMEQNVGMVTGRALRDAFGSLLHSIRFPLFGAKELANGPVTDGLLTSDEIAGLFQFLFADIKPELPFLTTPREPLPHAFCCDFKVVTGSTSKTTVTVRAHSDLAPECGAFLCQLFEDKLHIRIASLDNEYVGKTVPLPAAVQEERSVLSHSLKDACWFQWDMEESVARNVRIGTGGKPYRYHSAVFGFVSGVERLGDDKGIHGIINLQFSFIVPCARWCA